MEILVIVVLIAIFIILIVLFDKKKREHFTIAKRNSIVCPIKEDKQYSILPKDYKVLIVQGNNYELTPKFYRHTGGGKKIPIVPLKYSRNSDELTYYFVIQIIPGYEYSIRVSENVEPLITDGDGKQISLTKIFDNNTYNEYIMDLFVSFP